jgi:class 3 adenylate cyclase/predicted ATPase
MFCDLVGSTPLSEQLDPEELRELVRAYQQTAAQAVERFAGHIAQYLGDGLMVYFGYPRAHEDDAARGVNAALAILEGVSGLDTRLRERLPELDPDATPLEVRIGVHTGRVVVGEMGGGSSHERLALGSAVNVASRLEEIAAPGQVLISDDTRRLVEGVFVFESLGYRPLKGILQPVGVHRVVRPSGVRSRLELAAMTGLTPLVGREHEIALLLDRWQQVNEGLGQVVQVSGEAGIGKSRVVHVLRQRLADESHTWLELRCSDYHRNSPFHPVIELLESRLMGPADSDEERVTRLEGALSEAGLDPSEVLPLFATLLSVGVPQHYAGPSGAPEEQRRRTLEALVSWTLGQCERQPVVLVAEDLHWVDPSTRELLEMLVDQAPTAPILIIPTFRPSFEPPWRVQSHVVQLALDPFTRRQVRAMVDSILGGQQLPGEVIEELIGRTDGVPLFVEELTKVVLESSSADGGELGHVIPATLQDSLMARLDRLDSAKEVAQLGAVLGGSFSFGLLRDVAEHDERKLQADLSRLEQAELLFRQGFPPNSTYVFKHALVEETARQSLLRSRRRELHARTARVLERRLGEGAEVQPELLADHLAEAGQTESAVGYYQQAGDRARERSAYAEAVAHHTRGLELVERLPESAERSARELRLQLALGLSLQVTEGYGSPAVERVFLRARELCREAGQVGELFSALWGLWRYYQQGHDYATALQLTEQLVELAETTREPALLLQAHHAGWTTRVVRGDLSEAEAHVRVGLSIYRREEHHALAQQFGNHDPGVCALGMGGWGLALQGRLDQAEKRAQEAIELADSLAHAYTRVTVRRYAVWIALTLRDAARVMEHVRARLRAAEELGGVPGDHPRFMAWLRGWEMFQSGRISVGLESMREGIEDMLAEDDLLILPLTLPILCEAYAVAGQPDRGLALLDQSRPQLESMGGTYADAELCRVRGELLSRRGVAAAREAEAAFREAIEVAHRQSAGLFELRAAVSLGRALSARGRAVEARELVGDVYARFDEGLDTLDLKEAGELLRALQ